MTHEQEYTYEVQDWMLRTARFHTSDKFGVRGNGADMGRRWEDKVRQHFYSLVAELAYLHHNREQGLDEDIVYTPDWEDADELTDLESGFETHRLDFDAFGKARLDVKMRMEWNFSNPDLIVRFEQDGTLHGQLFVQVDLDWDGEWMTLNDIYHELDNPRGTEYPKTMVKRDWLHDIDAIENLANYVAAMREGRGDEPETIEARSDYQSFSEEYEANERDAAQRKANGETANA
jgi:hypothetical protein